METIKNLTITLTMLVASASALADEPSCPYQGSVYPMGDSVAVLVEGGDPANDGDYIVWSCAGVSDPTSSTPELIGATWVITERTPAFDSWVYRR